MAQEEGRSPLQMPHPFYRAFKGGEYKDILKAVQECKRYNDNGLAYVEQLSMRTAALPYHWEQYPEDLVKFLKKEIVEIGINRLFERELLINWSTGVHALYPIVTTGDGNCLLHAVALYMWGIEDTQLLLRNCLYDTLNHGLFAAENMNRWQAERRTNDTTAMSFEFRYNTNEWGREYEMVKQMATSEKSRNPANLPYQSLEEFHIFVLANILRRPILVISQDKMHSMQGASWQSHPVSGLYLPLNWDPSLCCKFPIVLGYHQNHFFPLLHTAPENKEEERDLIVPIVKSDSELVTIHFMLPRDDPMELLKMYLKCETFIHWPDNRETAVALLGAKLSCYSLGKTLSVWEAYFSEAEINIRIYYEKEYNPQQAGEEQDLRGYEEGVGVGNVDHEYFRSIKYPGRDNPIPHARGPGQCKTPGCPYQQSKDLETLSEELQQTQMKYTKEIQELTQMRKESTEKIERLAEELEWTQKKSKNEIETWTENLKQTKQSKAESVRQIEAMTEELTKMRRESTENMKKLTEELEQSEQSKAESVRQIETMTEELTQRRRESTENMKKLTVELEQTKQSLDLSRTESTNEIETLTAELRETKQKLVTRIKELGTANKDLDVTKQLLKEITQDRDITRSELKQYQLDFAMESKALKEVLNQTKEAMAELHSKRAVDDLPLVDSEETGDEGVSILAAEFGRLTVAIAEHLTLDHCLKLARFCNIPASDCDTVLRLSLIESPGMKFLDVLKKRKVINKFDVTNLQKVLAMLHLETVNHDLVRPYQEGIDKEQYELYKVEEMYTWEDVDAFVDAVKEDTARCQVRESQTSLEDDAKPDNTSQAEATSQQPETGVEGRRSLSRGRHHQLYIEHNIGREGGTIQLANVSLTVPPDALHEHHVIALSVMNESPFPLDREIDIARMTPLIKLEPLGLMFKKSLQLNIPHSALIPEPENYDVIIYLGQISKKIEDSSDSITWTEERSIPRQLKEKSVTVDIQCLSYLSASLVSQTTAPPLYIVRAVPFVDGVRNTDDDITLTICFCSDSDSEYNMLLRDYQTKLPLEQYSTLQLRRHAEREENDAGFLSVTVTSVNNTYVPDAEQAVKKFSVSHLSTASRVSHQLRLNKNQDTDRDVVDIMLTFSQAQYGPTNILLKAKIKDLIISEESEKLLTGYLPPGNKIYEHMVVNISSSLDTEHCRKLAMYFELTSEDTEIITSSQDPGKMLMKTLEERSVIDSQKMILFFEGLKACHLDEIAKLVSEYTSEISKPTQEKEQKPEEDTKTEETGEGTLVSHHLLKKSQRTARSSLSDQSVQTTLSSSCVSSDVHVKTLTKEGYTEHEVVEALDISRNRLVMARKVLQCIGELDVLPTKDYIFLNKEQYIDENGGEITLREANVHLLIPVGAVSKGSIVSLTMMTNKQGNVPSEGRTPQLSPVIKCGQEGLTLNKAVTLRIPHCATEAEGITSTDIYLGFSSNGEEIQWRKRKHHEAKPTLEENHFEISVQKFCTISMNIAVDFKKPLSKRFRVLPLISRIVNPTDDLTVTLWIYNDDETEHMHLLQEEINVHGKIQLHDFKKFTLKGSEKDKEVDIKSGNNKIVSHANVNMKKVLSTTLWHNTRYAVEFHFQNKEGIRDVSFSLRLCTKQLLRTVVDLQFDPKINLSELLQKPQGSIRALHGTQEPQPAMEKSFRELVSKLSVQLDVDACLEIAGIFRLSSNLRDQVKKNSEPGKVIFDELIHEQLITAASVSALDVALTRTGNVHLAEDVKEYRHRYLTFPTTIFTLL